MKELTEKEKAAQAKSRLELERQVAEHKRLIAEGKKAPLKTADERQAERRASSGVVCLGDAMKETLAGLEAMRDKLNLHAEKVRGRMLQLEPEYCEDHPAKPLEIDEEGTIGHSWIHQSFNVVYKGCVECQREKREFAERSRWLDRGIPSKVLHATFENYDTAADERRVVVLQKFKKQVKRGSGFIVALGKYGTGKTHLAAAAMKQVGSGLFVTMHDLVAEMRDTYTDNSSLDKVTERYRNAKVLVMDELTKEVFDPASKKGLDIPPLLYRILGYRYDKDLLTIITSNEELEDCLSILGGKLRDRMRENYSVCNFAWESHRTTKENL